MRMTIPKAGRSAGTVAAAVICAVGLLVGTGSAAAASPAERARGEELYSSADFRGALAVFEALSAADLADVKLRMRVLQCKIALGSATAAEQGELGTLRTQWSRGLAAKAAAARDRAMEAMRLARDGKIDEAHGMVRTADAELSALAGDIDVSAAKAAVADAMRVVQSGPVRRAVAADRPLGEPAAARGRHRLVKEGDTYRIVAAAEPVLAAAAGAPAGEPAKAAAAPATGAAVPPPPVVVPAPMDVVPRPVPPFVDRSRLTKDDVLWKFGDYVDLPKAVQYDILLAEQYIRQAPKYHYERMLALAREQAAAAALVDARREGMMPVFRNPNLDYVVELPRGVDFRAPSPDNTGIKLGDEPNGMETVAYDLSFLMLSDGPFDGLSYSRYLYNGYENAFVHALTDPGVSFYSPTFVGGGGWGAPGGAMGGGFGGFGGGFPQSRNQIFGGTPADFATGYPYVLNYIHNNLFGYRDPVQVAQLMNQLNVIVRDPALGGVPARPAPGAATPAPAPLPGN